MPILIIGEVERRQIEKVKKRARREPVRMTADDISELTPLMDKTQLRLDERPAKFIRPPSFYVNFPGGYSAAFSYEVQPAGLCAHLSVSVRGRERKGMMPSPEAVKAIAEEFGMADDIEKTWIEEFEPGEFAINLISVVEPAAVGNA